MLLVYFSSCMNLSILIYLENKPQKVVIFKNPKRFFKGKSSLEHLEALDCP